MTEYDSFRNGAVEELLSENNAYEMNGGYDLAAIKNGIPALAYVDATRGVFVTSRGAEIELSGQAISSLMLERITNQGKPKIPRKEVLLLGKHKELQANAHDPDYLALLEEWKSEQNINVMRYVFVVGVKGQPPQEFVDAQKLFFPDANELELKYLWVTSRLPDEDIDVFTEAVLGKTIATAKGLEEAANFSKSGSMGTP